MSWPRVCFRKRIVLGALCALSSSCNYIADRGLDPAKVEVKYPAEKTYIRRAVDRILAQGRLAGELRVDDAGRPFYWVTQYGPLSQRAPESPSGRTAD